ncbi:hypothetical protein ABT300_37245 [Streptomyces sp. NPDC001027]|uniref:hypothetical protein n=1 Tax=Streptomyces sp. NPDC001027 TaxID=3154771 RepID=UPI003321101A
MNVWKKVCEKTRTFEEIHVRSGPEPVIPAVERLNAVCVLIGALEELSRSSENRDNGVFSWEMLREQFPDRSPWKTQVLDQLFSYPAVMGIPAVRGLAAARLLLGRPGPTERMLLDGVLVAAASLSNVHTHYGGDGSDHHSYVGLATAFLARLFPNDARAQRVCLKYLSFQTCLSYAVSGAVKVASPQWRSGRAITGIMRTGTYGDGWLYELTKRYPTIRVLMAWMVILGELSFPLVLVAPKPVARAMLASSTVFHLANGRFMGLNRFVWGFTGSYPAVAYMSRGMGQAASGQLGSGAR